MTKQEAYQIIRENKDKPPYEIKRLISEKLGMRQRAKFTKEHLFQLITEVNEIDKNKEKVFDNDTISNTKKVEGDER